LSIMAGSLPGDNYLPNARDRIPAYLVWVHKEEGWIVSVCYPKAADSTGAV
jgi:hypothetical protein